MSYVNKSLQKKDAMALVTGKPVYTDDLASDSGNLCSGIL